MMTEKLRAILPNITSAELNGNSLTISSISTPILLEKDSKGMFYSSPNNAHSHPHGDTAFTASSSHDTPVHVISNHPRAHDNKDNDHRDSKDAHLPTSQTQGTLTPAQLWHVQTHFKAMEKVHGHPLLQNTTCESCIIERATRRPHNKELD